MPALTSPDRSITVYRPTARAADWSTFLTQLADSSRRYVRAPAGTFDVGAGLTISRGDLHVDFRGCVLTVQDPTLIPVTVASATEAIPEHQIVGEVTGGVTSQFTSPETDWLATVQAGDDHLIRVGVQKYDPQEPLYTVIRTVAAVEGGTITYSVPLPKTQPVYASEAELEALTDYPERVGPWGIYSGSGTTVPDGFFQRGLGLDHGVRKITSLADDVVIDELSLIYDGDERMYGAWGIYVFTSRRVTLNRCHVYNPQGSALHMWFAQDAVINGFSVGGVGRGAPFGGTSKTNYGVAVTAWASNDCTINDIVVDGTDIELCNFESGCENIVFNRGLIRNVHGGTVVSSPHFGAFGPGKVTFDGTSVDIAAASSRMITFVYETYLKNINILTEAMPDTVQWDGLKGIWQEGLTWNGIEFSAPEEVDVVFTPVAPNSAIPYPEGIIMEATWTLSTRDGFSSFNLGGSDPFQQNPGDLVFSATVAQLQIAFGTTYAQYLASLASDLIYSTSPSEVTMRVKIMRRIP